jgi:glycine dehydrogenase
MGPICVAEHLASFLPDHPVVPLGIPHSCGTVSAAPWGSPSILPISYAYIALMGTDGLAEATKIAILNANYIAHRLKGHFEVLYSGAHGLVAHECIVDMRPFKQSAGVEVEDIAKRIIDYGFHPPTVSFPVPGTLMVEPTESEPKEELTGSSTMISIRGEIREIEEGRRLATTTCSQFAAPWCRSSGTARSAPTAASAPHSPPRLREHKTWPTVGRIDGAYGDRNLVCTCPSMEEYGSNRD